MYKTVSAAHSSQELQSLSVKAVTIYNVFLSKSLNCFLIMNEKNLSCFVYLPILSQDRGSLDLCSREQSLPGAQGPGVVDEASATT